MDPKQISIGAVAIAALVVAVAKPSTKEYVAATASEADQEVTEVVKASSEVKPVTCRKQSHVLRIERGPELLWICDDVGYDAARAARLEKRAGADGNEVQYNPSEEDGGISVDIMVRKGAPLVLPWEPAPEPIKEPKGEIIP